MIHTRKATSLGVRPNQKNKLITSSMQIMLPPRVWQATSVSYRAFLLQLT